MRVPIENGLGLINQVLDFIKLPAVTGTEFCKELFEDDFSCCQVFIFGKHMIHIGSFL